MDVAAKDFSIAETITLSHCIQSFSHIIQSTTITTRQQESITTHLGMHEILMYLDKCRTQNGTVYIAGNGGSAAIAGYAVVDFINMNKIRATAMLDATVTTCISNDYGYEHVYEKQLAQFIEENDVLTAISSSGQSKNIMNAASVAKNRNAKVFTLTGFLIDNPLRRMGDYNLWLNSKDYGQVEIGHAFILHCLTDRLREMLAKTNQIAYKDRL